MNTQPQAMHEKKEEKADKFQNFSVKMTAGIALATGGAAIGTFFGGPVGATVGGLISGVAGFVVSGSHNESTPHN